MSEVDNFVLVSEKRTLRPTVRLQRAFVGTLVVVLATALHFSVSAQVSPKALSRDEVVTLLKGAVSPKRVGELVGQRGIDFEVTPNTELELRKVCPRDLPQTCAEFLTTLREAKHPQLPTNAGSERTVPLDGTSLQVVLSPGWQRMPIARGLQSMGLQYKGNPALEISAMEGRPESARYPGSSIGLPLECDFMYGSLQSAMNAKTVLLPRPEYVPREYYSRILAFKPVEAPGEIDACLFLGSSTISILVRPAPTVANSANLTEILQSIADSAKRKSTLLYAPGQLKLPILGVTASLSEGIWGVGTTTNPALGKMDLLIRTGGIAELKVMPIIVGGQCSDAMNSVMQLKDLGAGFAPVLLKQPSFVSSAWEQTAITMDPHKESADRMQFMVCRQLSPSQTLQVHLAYGLEEIPPSDAPLIAKALDEIAAAVMSKQ